MHEILLDLTRMSTERFRLAMAAASVPDLTHALSDPCCPAVVERIRREGARPRDAVLAEWRRLLRQANSDACQKDRPQTGPLFQVQTLDVNEAVLREHLQAWTETLIRAGVVMAKQSPWLWDTPAGLQKARQCADETILLSLFALTASFSNTMRPLAARTACLIRGRKFLDQCHTPPQIRDAQRGLVVCGCQPCTTAATSPECVTYEQPAAINFISHAPPGFPSMEAHSLPLQCCRLCHDKGIRYGYCSRACQKADWESHRKQFHPE